MMEVLISIIITGHTLHYTLHMDESWIFILSSHQMAPHFGTYFVGILGSRIFRQNSFWRSRSTIYHVPQSICQTFFIWLSVDNLLSNINVDKVSRTRRVRTDGYSCCVPAPDQEKEPAVFVSSQGGCWQLGSPAPVLAISRQMKYDVQWSGQHHIIHCIHNQHQQYNADNNMNAFCLELPWIYYV